LGSRLTKITLEKSIRKPPPLATSILTDHGWLAGLPDEFKSYLLSDASLVRFEAGDTIIMAGEETRELLGLCEGLVNITSALGLADTPLLLHLGRPPFWFGHGPLFTGRPRGATVVGRTTGTFARISGKRVDQLLARGPEYSRHFFLLAADYGNLASVIASDLTIRGSQKRLIAVLLRMAGYRGLREGPPLTFVPVNQGELASACNMSRNTVVSIVQRLVAKSLVGVTRTGVTIKDPAALAQMLK
jgi:CRP-like cAMP-binding protein